MFYKTTTMHLLKKVLFIFQSIITGIFVSILLQHFHKEYWKSYKIIPTFKFFWAENFNKDIDKILSNKKKLNRRWIVIETDFY